MQQEWWFQEVHLGLVRALQSFGLLPPGFEVYLTISVFFQPWDVEGLAVDTVYSDWRIKYRLS